MGSVVMGGGLMDLLIRPMKCPGRPCLIGGGYLNRYPTLGSFIVGIWGLVGGSWVVISGGVSVG